MNCGGSGCPWQTLTEHYSYQCMTATPTRTFTPIPTITLTPTNTPTTTSTPTITLTPTNSPTPTVTNTPTNTPTTTSTPTITLTPTQTTTSTVTPTSTVSTMTATSTVTITPCPMTFTDVHPSDYFYQPVHNLYCRGVISGYADNTLRPYNNTTRGQLTKIVVLAEGFPVYTPTVPTFRDVPSAHTFYQHIETAYHQGIISGYSCGAGCLEFRPSDDITRGQLCKQGRAYKLHLYPPPKPILRIIPSNHPLYS